MQFIALPPPANGTLEIRRSEDVCNPIDKYDTFRPAAHSDADGFMPGGFLAER